MPQAFHKFRLPPENGYPIIDTNSASKTRGDALVIDSAGFLDLAAVGGRVLGFCIATVTVTSDNQTVAKAKSQYCPSEGVLMFYGSDIALVQTDIGAYADFDTVTTGAFRVNLLAGAHGTLHVLGGPDPDNLTTEVIVEVAEPQSLAYAQQV